MSTSREMLINATRFFYDLQKLRIQSANRASRKAEGAEARLDDDDKAFLESAGEGLNALEKAALKEVGRHLQPHDVYHQFMVNVRGLGPAMSAVLISYVNIDRCQTASELWAWCGLAVRADGRADHLVKGEKAHFNPWLKSKMIEVLGKNLVKAYTLGDNGDYYYTVHCKDGSKRMPPKGIVYRKFYDDYKHRKQHQLVDTCMLCKGTGLVKVTKKKLAHCEVEEVVVAKKGEKEAKECWNCGGTGGPAPWGCGDKHREVAARRYMVKMLLLDLWKFWRQLEGLPVRPSFAEERLNRHHHVEGVAVGL